MIVMTREDMQLRGISTIEDAIRSLPQNFATLNATAGSARQGQGLGNDLGQLSINLRGLGDGNTLVLVNGRRRVQSAALDNGAVNLNGIPFSAIERIEVIPDGASAIYGSDAQAGVINFILRDDYAGSETSLRQEIGAHEGDSRTIEQTLGYTWNGGGITGTLSYREGESVDSRKAGHTTADYRSLGGSDHRSPFSQPGRVFVGLSPPPWGRLLGSLPAGDDGTQGVVDKLSPDNTVPYDYVALGPKATAKTESLTGHLSTNHEFFDGRVKWFGELQYADNESDDHGVVSQYTVYPTAANPYNDISQRFPGERVTVQFVFAAETEAGLLPNSSAESGQKNLTLTTGAEIELPFRDWVSSFSVSDGGEDSYVGLESINHNLIMARAAGVDAQGNPIPPAEIINPFGNGTAQNPSALEGVVVLDSGEGSFVRPKTNKSDQNDYELTLDGTLFELPGGSSTFVLGGERRTETLDFSTDISKGQFIAVIKPERDIESWFAEWGLPFVTEKNSLPGVHSLGIKLAARRESASFSGPFDGPGAPVIEKSFSHLAPKVDFTWRPVKSLNVRASLGESSVAPRTNELFGRVLFEFPFAIVDPARPELGQQFPIMRLASGNSDLEPEISKNLSAGIDWTPGGALEGLGVGLTLIEIDVEDRIGNLSFNQLNLLFEVPGGVEYAPDGTVAYLNLAPVNLARVDSRSVDLAIDYRRDTNYGLVSAGLDVTWTDSLKEWAAPGSEPVETVGTADGPDRYRATGFVGLSRGPLSVVLTGHYTPTYDAPLSFPGSTTTGIQERVGSYLTWDLTGRYVFEESGWEVHLGGRNLLDEDFPFFDSRSAPYDGKRVDTRGRLIHFQVKKIFDLPI